MADRFPVRQEVIFRKFIYGRIPYNNVWVLVTHYGNLYQMRYLHKKPTQRQLRQSKKKIKQIAKILLKDTEQAFKVPYKGDKY